MNNKDPLAIDMRWTERPSTSQDGESAEDRAAALLRRLRPPPPLPPEVLARIEARLVTATARPPWVYLLLPALCGVGAALVLLAPLRPPAPWVAAAQEVAVPAGGTTRLSKAGAQLVLAGPAAATLPRSGPLKLREGRLLVRAGEAPVRVVVPGGEVRLGAGAVVEIQVRARGGLRVATFFGDVAVTRDERTIIVAEGTALAEDTAPIAAEERTAAEQLFGVSLPPPGVSLPSQVAPAARLRAGEGLVQPELRREQPPRQRTTAPTPAAPKMPAAGPSSVPVVRHGANPILGGEPSMPAAGPSSVPVVPTGLAAESMLLIDALAQLRAGEAAAALALLDEYRQRFPDGALRREALDARIDAQLHLGRRSVALAELDGAQPAELLPERRVLRGELRARAGRCIEAIADFGAALDSELAPGTAERALYGRASCRARIGDDKAAQTDLRAYLQRFPNGRFSDAARDALGK